MPEHKRIAYSISITHCVPSSTCHISQTRDKCFWLGQIALSCESSHLCVLSLQKLYSTGVTRHYMWESRRDPANPRNPGNPANPANPGNSANPAISGIHGIPQKHNRKHVYDVYKDYSRSHSFHWHPY